MLRWPLRWPLRWCLVAGRGRGGRRACSRARVLGTAAILSLRAVMAAAPTARTRKKAGATVPRRSERNWYSPTAGPAAALPRTCGGGRRYSKTLLEIYWGIAEDQVLGGRMVIFENFIGNQGYCQ